MSKSRLTTVAMAVVAIAIINRIPAAKKVVNGSWAMDPVKYVKENTDPKIVVSSVVAAFAVGGALLLLKNSGVGPLQAVAKAAGK